MATDPETLFVAHRQGLLGYFRRAVGEAELARDLTQDVFVKASGRPVPEGGERDIRAWLFGIARNVAIDHYRRRRREPFTQTVPQDHGHAASQDIDLAVREALATLDDLDRDVFLMREVGGLSYIEAGRACGLTPDAVRSRIHRARLQLRARLAAPIATRASQPMRLSGRDPQS